LKLNKLKELVDFAHEKANGMDVDVEFWLGEKELELVRAGQFGVIPDVNFNFELYEETAEET
jgi:hypothetical protein